MTKLMQTYGWLAAGLFGFTAACSATQPSEGLVDARKTVARAEESAAKEAQPETVAEAQTDIKEANEAFEDDGNEPKTDELAYIAKRRAELAMQETERQNAAAEKEAAEADYTDALETKVASLQSQQVAPPPSRENVLCAIKGAVRFDTDKAELSAADKRRLKNLATSLRNVGFNEVVVEGHADSRGPAEYNEKLSNRRAKAVEQYLKTQGIKASTYKTEAKGESDPIAPNSSVEGRRMNRRATIKLNE